MLKDEADNEALVHYLRDLFMKIHYCDWASQPDIKYACGKFTTPLWGKCAVVLPKDVYAADDKDYYTFDYKLFNCIDCKLNAKV